MSDDRVALNIGASTKFIISTSGRPKSLKRYKYLLQDSLKLDIAYIPISSQGGGKIEPENFVNVIKGLNCIGGAISKDIKYGIIPFLDELDPLAQQIQSVNTVIRLENGKLKGYNTDALGFRHAITNGIDKAGVTVKTAVVYGYGGVSSVVFHILQELGIRVFVTGRNLESAAARAEEFKVEVFDFESGNSCDLFVNATPVTDRDLQLADNFLPALKNCKIAFDHEMPGQCLIDYCKQNNIFHISGYDMYWPQMEIQWQFFLDGLVPKEDVQALLQEAEKNCL